MAWYLAMQAHRCLSRLMGLVDLGLSIWGILRYVIVTFSLVPLLRGMIFQLKDELEQLIVS